MPSVPYKEALPEALQRGVRQWPWALHCIGFLLKCDISFPSLCVHLQNEEKKKLLHHGLVNDLEQVKHLAQLLAHSKCAFNVSCGAMLQSLWLLL